MNMTRHFFFHAGTLLCVPVLTAILSCALIIPAKAQDFNEEKVELHNKAKDAFWNGDFDEMERLNNFYLQKDRSNLTRYARMYSVRNGFGTILHGFDGSTDLYFAEVQALTGEWAARHPDSPFAHILHAKAISARGWAFRGGGYANTVPPAAWADFRRYSEQAAQYLQAHAQVAFRDSEAHLTLMKIGRAIAWPPEKILLIAEHGLQIEPENDELNFEMMRNYLPKWGGNVKALDDYILNVLERTRATKGMGWYTRLYAQAADEQFHHALFEDSLIDWAKMKQGFEALIERERSSARINNYAYMACLAQDKATLRAQLTVLGSEKPNLEHWGENGARSYQACKRLANEP